MTKPITVGRFRPSGRSQLYGTLAGWLQAGDCEPVVGFIIGRYEVVVSCETVQQWRLAYMAQYGLQEFPLLATPDAWLKSRIKTEAGHCEALIRVECELHVFPIHWEQVECRLTDEDIVAIQKRLRRLAEARSSTHKLIAASANPIDRTAARVVPDDSQGCPWCREWFRNPAALAIHAEERHGQLVRIAHKPT